MPTIAPWLVPPNFLQAIESGARIGLSQAELAQRAEEERNRLALQAQENSGRLGLAYAHLQDAQNQRTQMRPYQEAEIELGRNRLLQTQQNEADQLGLSRQRYDADLVQNAAANALRKRELDISEGKIKDVGEAKKANALAYDAAFKAWQSGVPFDQIDVGDLTATQINSLRNADTTRTAKKTGGPRISWDVRGSKFGPALASISGPADDPEFLAAAPEEVRKIFGARQVARGVNPEELVLQIKSENPGMSSAQIAAEINRRMAGGAATGPVPAAQALRSAPALPTPEPRAVVPPPQDTGSGFVDVGPVGQVRAISDLNDAALQLRNDQMAKRQAELESRRRDEEQTQAEVARIRALDAQRDEQKRKERVAQLEHELIRSRTQPGYAIPAMDYSIKYEELQRLLNGGK